MRETMCLKFSSLFSWRLGVINFYYTTLKMLIYPSLVLGGGTFKHKKAPFNFLKSLVKVALWQPHAHTVHSNCYYSHFLLYPCHFYYHLCFVKPWLYPEPSLWPLPWSRMGFSVGTKPKTICAPLPESLSSQSIVEQGGPCRPHHSLWSSIDKSTFVQPVTTARVHDSTGCVMPKRQHLYRCSPYHSTFLFLYLLHFFNVPGALEGGNTNALFSAEHWELLILAFTIIHCPEKLL